MALSTNIEDLKTIITDINVEIKRLENTTAITLRVLKNRKAMLEKLLEEAEKK
jgi:hypothetical protein